MELNEPAAGLKLPLSVVSSSDVSRLLRELSRLSDEMVQARIRQTDDQPVAVPKLTHQLEDLVTENSIDLQSEASRNALIEILTELTNHSPSLHISFATEPSPKAVGKILMWLRHNIHPQTLMTIGLQPTIAAGMVVRTPNLLLDMSLRQYLQQQEPLLTQMIKEMGRAE